MKAWPVDQRINNVKNNDPELGEPFNEEADGQLGIFFDASQTTDPHSHFAIFALEQRLKRRPMSC